MGIISDNCIVSTTKDKVASPKIGMIAKGPDRVEEVVDDGPSYLYLFDADSNSVGTPPADIISEDSTDAYEIVDAGGALGLGLRKKTTDSTASWCFFNEYNTFAVRVLVTYKFYILDVTNYFQFAFGLNLVNGANGGGYVTGLVRDASTGKGKHQGWGANTNVKNLSVVGALDLDAGGYAYLQNVATNTLFTAECWIEASNNRQRMRVSADGGSTRSHTTQVDAGKAQNVVGYLDGYGATRSVHLKRVEVTEYTA